jgi:hypothetical protein
VLAITTFTAGCNKPRVVASPTVERREPIREMWIHAYAFERTSPATAGTLEVTRESKR